MSTPATPKRRFRRGCVVTVLALLLTPAICCGSMWLFARYGGEWATLGDIPIPDNSQFIAATYDTGRHVEKHSFYLHHAMPDELRGWYIVEAHIGLTPIALDLENSRFIDNPDFYMESPTFHQTTFWSRLYATSTMFAAGRYDEVVPDCQGVHIYKNHAAAVRDFPDLNLPDDKTLVVISTCWLNVN